jgi:hypothetical protein
MIFRAIFWIGLVALLMPREPDLGLGRPGPSPSSVMSSITHLGITRPDQVCEQHAQACAGGLTILDSFQDKALRGLAEVRAEIEISRKTGPARQL